MNIIYMYIYICRERESYIPIYTIQDTLLHNILYIIYIGHTGIGWDWGIHHAYTYTHIHTTHLASRPGQVELGAPSMLGA